MKPPRRKEHEFFDSPDDEELSEKELEERLNQIAPLIGRVIIEFNSLEDSVTHYLIEMLSESFAQDEMIGIVIGELMYRAKSEALIRAYRHSIRYGMDENGSLSAKLNSLEKKLEKAAESRNGYAHGSWSEISKSGYVVVRTKAKKAGPVHRYIRYEVPEIESDIRMIIQTRELLDEFDELLYESSRR